VWCFALAVFFVVHVVSFFDALFFFFFHLPSPAAKVVAHIFFQMTYMNTPLWPS
jgi:hypothetical protein